MSASDNNENKEDNQKNAKEKSKKSSNGDDSKKSSSINAEYDEIFKNLSKECVKLYRANKSFSGSNPKAIQIFREAESIHRKLSNAMLKLKE